MPRKSPSSGPSLDSAANAELKALVQFVDANSDGLLDMTELDRAFRKARRARVNAEEELLGRKLVRRLAKLINYVGYSVVDWFDEIDTSQAGLGDGKLSKLELKRGMELRVPRDPLAPLLKRLGSERA